MNPRDRRLADDDDGRTVADMSEVGRPSLLLPRFDAPWERAPEGEPKGAAPAPQTQIDRSERRAMLGGALSAGLLIGLVFAAGFAILILLIQWIWG